MNAARGGPVVGISWSVPAADALLDLLTVGVMLLGPQRELIFVNRAARELLGLPDSAEAGRSWSTIEAVHEDGTPFPPADHPCSTALATGRGVRGVLMGFDPPGRRRVWALAGAEPLLGEDGIPHMVVCTLQDVTRQRRREGRLRESELRYRQTLDRVQEVVWRTNGAGRVTYVNSAACRLLGRPASELIGRQGLDFVRADQRTALRHTLSRLARERSGIFYDEMVVTDRNGRPVRLNQQVQVLVDGGRVRGFQGVAQDAAGSPRLYPAVPAEKADSAAPSPEAAAPPARILVVDDNDVNLKVTVAMLESLGYQADTAENGLEAVHACEHRTYDAVLMDCQMPQMDGFKATAFIREREGARRHTPIIALTASVLPGERQKCLSAGMDDFLCKPVSLRQLDETLRRWTAPREPEPESGRWVLAVEHPLRTLEMQGLGSLVAEVFGTFLETTPAYVRQMHAACARGDASHLVSLAHSLKGAAVQVGAEDMAEICAQVQGNARSGELTGVAALIVALESTFEGLRRVLEPQRQRLLQAALPG